MRTSTARYLLAVLTAMIFSGCYSGGRWSMPNLAFWKSSPFDSSHAITPGSVGSPVKPSGIAANSKTGNTLAPPANYASTGATMPPTTSLGAPTNYSAPTAYPTTQQYPETGTSPAPAYVASTAGVPGASAYAAPPATSYGSTSSYANSAAPAYNTTSAASGGYGYSPPPTADAYQNPVRTTPSYPSTDYGPKIANTEADRYGSNTATNNYGSSAPTGAAPSYNTSTTSSYGADVGPRYANTPSSSSNPAESSDAASYSGDRYSTPGDVPLVGSRYNTPTGASYAPSGNESTPAGSGTNTTGGYYPSYNAPPSSGNSIPDASRYSPSGGYSIPPASGTNDYPSYRPGSTSDYTPRNTTTSSGGTLTATPAASSDVTPVSYTPPITSTVR